MKKSIFTIIIFFLVSSTGFIQAQSLDDVLAKHFKTIGQEKLNKVKTYTIKANISQMGMDLPMVMKMKKPNKFRMEMDMMGQKMIQAFDGEKGWVIAPWVSTEPQDLTGAELQQALEQADIDGELYNYKEKGHTAELIGKENLDGTDVYNIKLTNKNGSVKNYYIDANKNLIVQVKAKAVNMGQEVNVTQKMSDYKDIDGILVATKITSETPMGDGVIVMEEVKFNEEVDDSIFERPAK